MHRSERVEPARGAARWLLAGAAAALLAGCQSGTGSGAVATPGPPTPTLTLPPMTSRPSPHMPTTTSPTLPPNPVEGRCPYLDAQTVADTIGEHISRSTVTPTRPYPGCSFYRPDGERAADIQVTVLPSPAAAQARAIALGGRTANPVSGVGDAGVVAITGTGAVLAVNKGPALVVVRINQRISLEAREIARYVVARL